MTHRKVLTASMIFLSWILLFSANTTFAETTYTSTSVTYQCGGSDTQPIISVTLYKTSPWGVEQSYTGTTKNPVCKNGEYLFFNGLTPNTSYQIAEMHQIPGCGWGACNPIFWLIFTTECDTIWYYDGDMDGYGTGYALRQCDNPGSIAQWKLNLPAGDCDDFNYTINPATVWYKDADNDNYTYGAIKTQCARPSGYKLAYELISTTILDCDDTNPAITINDSLWYKDADNDGYTDGATLTQCTQPSGYKSASELYSTTILDCNDADPAINVPSTWYKDADGDGYTEGSTQTSCSQPSGYVSSAQPGDCNDDDTSIHPGAVETCDGVDNNCNGQTDEGLSTDADGDGHYTYESCAIPNDDCDDTNPDKTTKCNNLPECPLSQNINSSNHVATGELTHDQTVFSVRGAALPISVALTYKSRSSNDGPLGIGWRHSYDMSISDKGSHALFMEGNGDSVIYNLTGGVYVTAAGNYSALVKNADNTYTVTEKDGLIYNFGTDGKVTSIIDRNGNIMTFSYSSGNLTSVTDPAGHTVTFTYDANNKITAISDPKGNAYTIAYTDNRLTSVTNPDGGSWQYTYDAAGYLLTKTDPGLKTITYAYDANHRLLSSTDPEGKIRSFTYPATTDAVRSTTFVEKDGGIWTKTYDITKGLLMSKTDSLGNTTSYTYDTKGNMLTKTEPGNITTSYTYDSSGNMLTVTNPLSQTTTYTYNSRGQVLTATDAKGTVTNIYDINGNLTSVTDISGATTQYQYTNGRLTKIINAANQETTFAYDTSGNLTSTTDITGATTTFTYDANGNMFTQTNSAGTTTFEYDGMNRLTKATDPQGHATTNTYDKMGNLITVKDANNTTTTYEYNYKGQVTKVTDALNNQTAYNYSGTGCSSCGGGVDKLTSITDAKSQKTSYAYDLLGRLTTETDPLNKAISYSYDTHGNLTSKTDANGITITYTYDALNRLTAKTYPDATTETYTYDNKGYLTSVANSNITYTMTYDTAGRVTNVTDNNGNTIAYEYNTLSQKTKATYPGGKVVNYSYDSVSRLQGITSDAGAFGFTYDSLSRRTGLSYPNGITTSYTYDAVGRLTDLTHSPSIASYMYTLDNVGNRTSVSGSTSATYSYDAIYRLTQATKTKESEAYTYDAVGNRLAGPGAKDTDYAYNAANQMTTGRKINYAYDNSGNQTERTLPNGTDKTWTQTWDYENRLVKLEKIKGTERKTFTFKYDPFERRIEKKLVTVKGGVTKTQTYSYVYDNEEIIQETLTTDTTTEVTRYTHGLGIDEPLSMERNGAYYYYHADGLGSITAITNGSKAVVQSYTYDSFGMPKPTTNFRNSYTYTGREWDSETGLYFYRARYYDPMAGRFISKDPIGFRGGINVYNYVKNNPIKWIDPMGLEVIGYDGPGNALVDNGNSYTSYKDGTYSGTVGKVPTGTGPFGPVCGPEGSVLATWIPDITPEACKKHDNCYEDCAKNCKGYDCKLKCDNELKGSNWPYGTATERFGNKIYDDLRKKHGCCN